MKEIISSMREGNLLALKKVLIASNTPVNVRGLSLRQRRLVALLVSDFPPENDTHTLSQRFGTFKIPFHWLWERQ